MMAEKPQSPSSGLSTTSFSSAAARPFGNGGFQPSTNRNRPVPTSFGSDTAVGPVGPQQLSFRSSRNRFQPNSATVITATSTSTTESTSTKRYNRFGSSRTGFKAFPPPSNVHVNNPELSRGHNKLPSRRPAFISREINEPTQNAKVQKQYPSPKAGRAKIPLKSQLLKQQLSPSSTPFRPMLPQTLSAQNESESVSEEYEKKVHGKNYLSQYDVKEPLLEKLQLNEAERTPLLQQVIETSTIYPTSSKDETTTIISAPFEQSTERHADISQDHEEDDYDKNYSDEYLQSQEDVKETTEENTTLTSESVDGQTTVNHSEPEEEYYELEEGEVRATVTPITDATFLKSNENIITTTTEESAAEEHGRVTAKDVIPVTTTEHIRVEPQTSNLEDEYDEDDYDENDEDEEDDEIIDRLELSNETQSHAHKNIEDETTTTILPTTTERINNVKMASVDGIRIARIKLPATTMSSEEESIFSETKSSPASDDSYEDKDESTTVKSIISSDESTSNATEGYVVVASIQTSRSINGARFLPFPAIQQEESKRSLSELERNAKAKFNKKDQDSVSEQAIESEEEEVGSTTQAEQSFGITTLPQASSSTESIIDKLDRVQSELSSGLLAGKYPIISQMDVSTQATTSTVGSKFAPNIRKFQPKTTSAPKVRVHHFDEPQSKVKVHHLDESEMDELASLLPVGFKPKFSYKIGKITTNATTTTQKPVEFKKPLRNSTIGRSIKNSAITAQDISLAGILPKGYNMATSTEKVKTDFDDILSRINFDDRLDKLLPKSYKSSPTTTKPALTLVDDISKFLPPGYKLRTTTPTTTTTAKSTKPSVLKMNKEFDNLLFPGYTSSLSDKHNNTNSVDSVEADDIFKLLPPGYKVRTTKIPDAMPHTETIDISNLLPKGYKPPETKDQENVDIFKKIEFKEIASLLPPGFKLNNTDVLNYNKHPASTSTIATSTTSITKKISETDEVQPNSGFKVVFPKGVHKRLGAQRITTIKTSDSVDEGPTSPSVVIKKGLPTRATTEFTGWPTPSTTPISIEKLLEQAKMATIDIDLLPTYTSTTTSTTTTTTTTTTTPKPTKPGVCTADCDLAATIKIVDGVSWQPELLDHNTVEWKNLAREVEAQLNEVFSTATDLKKWYKKVRIDSFSKGSVLIDYYVELSNITKDVNTLEIKKLFHDALISQTSGPTDKENQTANDGFGEIGSQQYTDGKDEKLVRTTFLMGKYAIDPIATDFSVIPKSLTPNVEFAEEDLLIPQWAIVVIVIGVGSLLFVVIFGVTVLLNRQKRAKKTPIPLTNDMLNELKINHMGGVDNYGVDDFYNIDDAWNDTKQPIKPKRFTNSMYDSSASNIFDSWRSTRHGDYYYDSQNNYSQKGDSLQRSIKHHPHSQNSTHGVHHQQTYGHQYPDAFSDAHQMYTYNNQTNGGGRSRYPRDYDPDF